MSPETYFDRITREIRAFRQEHNRHPTELHIEDGAFTELVHTARADQFDIVQTAQGMERKFLGLRIVRHQGKDGVRLE